MILQLIKRDPAMRFAPWLLASAVLAATFGPHGGIGASLSGMAVAPFMGFFMLAAPHHRAGFFEAALPSRAAP